MHQEKDAAITRPLAAYMVACQGEGIQRFETLLSQTKRKGSRDYTQARVQSMTPDQHGEKQVCGFLSPESAKGESQTAIPCRCPAPKSKPGWLVLTSLFQRAERVL